MEETGAKPALREQAGRRLQDELLIDILNHAPDAISIVEVVRGARDKFMFLYVNDAFESLYLASKSEVIGADVVEFMSTRAQPRDTEKTLALFAEGKAFTTTRPYARSDGKTVWLEVNFRPILMEDQPVRWIYIARDVTAKKLLQDRTMQLSIAVEEGDDCVAISVDTDAQGIWRFAYVNEALTRTTGYSIDELIGRPISEALWPQEGDAEHLKAIREALFSGKSLRDEVPLRRKDGSIGFFEITNKPIEDPYTKKYESLVTIFRDITERKKREQALRYEAEHDQLTSLYNRRHIERELHRVLAQDESKAMLVFVDMDGFKYVNDLLGHDAGDTVLRAAADAFRSCMRETDVLARWGGDEFAAILRNCDRREAERVAECMLRAFQSTPNRQWVTASIGAVPLLGGSSLTETVRRADKACYAAKAGGGDRAVIET